MRISVPLLGHPVETIRSGPAWILTGAGVLLGIAGLLSGIRFLTAFGLLVGISGLLLYGRPAITAFRKAPPMNPLPLWFLVSATFWLLFLPLVIRVSLFPGILMVFLLGWLGQFFLAHLYHLGPRLLGIFGNGPQDITPPVALLDRRRSRITFLLYQAGIALGIFSVFYPKILPGEFRCLGPVLGFFAWLSLSMEIRSAWRKAGKIPPPEEMIFIPSLGRGDR